MKKLFLFLSLVSANATVVTNYVTDQQGIPLNGWVVITPFNKQLQNGLTNVFGPSFSSQIVNGRWSASMLTRGFFYVDQGIGDPVYIFTIDNLTNSFAFYANAATNPIPTFTPYITYNITNSSSLPVNDIRSFGAVMDDSTDDTFAIQQAIYAAYTNGNPVVIPGYPYRSKVSTSLVITNGPLTIQANSPGSIPWYPNWWYNLRLTGNTNLFYITNYGNIQASGITFQNIGAYGPGLSSSLSTFLKIDQGNVAFVPESIKVLSCTLSNFATSIIDGSAASVWIEEGWYVHTINGVVESNGVNQVNVKGLNLFDVTNEFIIHGGQMKLDSSQGLANRRTILMNTVSAPTLICENCNFEQFSGTNEVIEAIGTANSTTRPRIKLDGVRFAYDGASVPWIGITVSNVDIEAKRINWGNICDANSIYINKKGNDSVVLTDQPIWVTNAVFNPGVEYAGTLPGYGSSGGGATIPGWSEPQASFPWVGPFWVHDYFDHYDYLMLPINTNNTVTSPLSYAIADLTDYWRDKFIRYAVYDWTTNAATPNPYYGKISYTNTASGITLGDPTGATWNLQPFTSRRFRYLVFNSGGGNINVVSPSKWKCSDYLTTHVLTNGNTMLFDGENFGNVWTNVIVTQFK